MGSKANEMTPLATQIMRECVRLQKKSGMTVAEFAKACGFSRDYWYKHANLSRPLTLGDLERISEVTGVSPGDIVIDSQRHAIEETNDEDESDGNDDDGIVTTEEEIAGYRIIKAIACSDVDPERVTMRDAKKYCAIFLDDNNRKPIVRLYFNTKQKYLGVFDENKNCERMPIDTLNGIYAYSEQIREEVRRLL